MGMSIHTNYTAMVTQNTLNSTNKMLGTAMERLGTGYRINSAADDAAGLQIATRLQAQTNGQGVAMRNSQDAISLMQTAEGAFDEITNIMHRMKDLATQGANGTNSEKDLTAMQAEYDELGKEMGNIVKNTSYAGDKLFSSGTSIDGSGGKFSDKVNFQIGSSAAEVLTLDVSKKLTGADSVAATITLASKAYEDGTAGTEIAVAAAAGAGTTTAGATIGLLDTALEAVGSIRADFGANINRLEHTITNLGNMRENGEAAKGRIMDADFAQEASNMSKNQMLMQSGMSVLSNANQMSGLVMSLLR